LMAATGNSPTAATGRSTHTSTRVTSLTTAKSEAVTSPTRTPARCESTWKSIASRPRPLPPTLRTIPLQTFSARPFLPPPNRTGTGQQISRLRLPTLMSGTCARGAGDPTISTPHPAMCQRRTRKRRTLSEIQTQGQCSNVYKQKKKNNCPNCLSNVYMCSSLTLRTHRQCLAQNKTQHHLDMYATTVQHSPSATISVKL
jgi:hypothetical protein